MVNDTLPVGIIVEVTRYDCNFLGKIAEVSSTHVMDDVWYRIIPLPGERGDNMKDQDGVSWHHQKHVSSIELMSLENRKE